MSGIVIHIGLPKTGTTTLQKKVFPCLSGVNYLGKIIPSYSFVSSRIQDAIYSTFSADSAIIDPVENLAESVAEFRKSSGAKKTLLISTESFAHPGTRDLGVVARRLSSAFPDARILVSIRAQEDLVLSWFRSHGRFAQYLTFHKTESESISTPLSQQTWWKFVIREQYAGLLAILDYEAIVSYYKSCFDSRIEILPVELISSGLYADILAKSLNVSANECKSLLINCHENKGITSRELFVYNIFSFFGYNTNFLESRDKNGFRKWLAKGPSPDRNLDSDILKYIQLRYSKGNSKLSAAYNLPLAKLGYSC
jgi:hypothetical protein